MLRIPVVLLINLVQILRLGMLRSFSRLLLAPKRRKQRRFVRLSLKSGLGLAAAPKKIGPLTIGVGGQGPYWAFHEAVERILKDESIEGVYFRCSGLGLGMRQVGLVNERLARLREAGKRVIAYLDQGMTTDYLLAASADTVLMAPPGRLYTFGMRADMMFLGEAFEKFGVQANFVNLGRFKTAAHRFTRATSTAPQRRMTRQLIGTLADQTLDHIAARRGLSKDHVQSLFDEAPVSARDARRKGLIDAMVYPDQIREHIQGDDPRKVVILSQDGYLRSSKPLKWRPLVKKKPVVAVLNLTGVILMGNEGVPGQVRQAITPKPVIRALKALRKSRQVKAVVLYIDSPGGSALASDLIWREIVKLDAEKPVVAVMGNVAASGGYYLSVGARSIVAQPQTVTGSIGVIAGKLAGGAALARLGITFESVDQSPTSGFTSLLRPMSDVELSNLHQDIRAFYRRFILRVAEGRQMSRDQVHRLAKGRVYTGGHAKRLGLVDELGDLDTGLDLACQLADLRRDSVEIALVEHEAKGWKALMKKDAAVTTLSEAALPDSESSAWGIELPKDAQTLLAAASLFKAPQAVALSPIFALP